MRARIAFFRLHAMILKKPLVLASRSPRRRLLLGQIGLEPRVIPCDIPEDFDPVKNPADNARSLAVQKAEAVAAGIDNAYVLGADTIVVLNGAMLGKPADREEAVRMLEKLSGKTHTVVTGFALIDRPSNETIVGTESTEVTFRDLPRAEIEEYAGGGSPLDKAGAYGIQDDYGAVFVTRIEGCFYNVVGLPLSRVHAALMMMQNRA